MIAAILAFLTAFFNNAGGILRQVAALFRPNVEKENEKIDDAASNETRERDDGGRPKWD